MYVLLPLKAGRLATTYFGDVCLTAVITKAFVAEQRLSYGSVLRAGTKVVPKGEGGEGM